MARGPFQGTFQPNVRPTVTVAPDALVYINGETEVFGCQSCRRKFDLHKYITTIQVDLSIDSCPGSASVSLTVPRHAIDDLYYEGQPVITPMMEIEIYAKGYYLVDGVPQYYPIFWGIVTEVTDQYSSGQHTISINCSDILKWWELCKININPAWTATKSAGMGWDLFGNVFHGMNPYDVIWTLAQQAMGDVVVGTGSLTSYNGEAVQKSTFSTALADLMLYWNDRFSRMRSNLLLYGAQGVAIRGATLWEKYPCKPGQPQKNFPYASQEVRNSNGGKYGGGLLFDPTGKNVTAFKTQFNNAGQVNLWQSEYQTKLELANAAKEAIGYEFYMDVTGDIVFKPPFYNLDTLPNKPVSWIQDIDIIDWDFSESESEVVTQVQMAGSFGGAIDYGMAADVEPQTSVTDWHLLRKYGWRTHQMNSEFLGDAQLMFYYGMDVMDRLNARRHRGTVSIPMRPELRLGFPVYVAPKDQMWYVTGISHNIQFGGTAQTTLSLSARRGKFFAPRGIGKISLTGWNKAAVTASKGNVNEANPNSTFKYTARQLSEGAEFKIEVGEAAVMPPPDIKVFEKPADQNPYSPLILRHPKTGRACGFPNVVMAYTRPFAQKLPINQTGQAGTKGRQNQLDPKTAEKKGETAKSLTTDVQASLSAGKKDELRVKYMQNRYMYGLNSAGVFAYLYDAGEGTGNSGKPVISEAMSIPVSRVTVDKSKAGTAGDGFKLSPKVHHVGMIRPVSDERGFEVVGHFRYGRGLSLRDGSLVLNDTGGGNKRASIDLQLGLTGTLSAALAAQSAGLTTISTPYSDPAANLARLVPEDLQTGAVAFNKGGGTPGITEAKFSTADQNFIDSAPLGTTESQKIPDSVEATQLSKALTLAELTYKYADGSTEGCNCMTARSDLAFIASGVKVTVVDGGATTPVSVPGAGNTDGPPVRSDVLPIGNPGDVAKRVDEYLFNLYKALDAPHQKLENVLRGSESGESDPYTVWRAEETPPNRAEYAPPFNAMERWNVNDPDAIGQMFDSAKAELEASWDSFTDQLKRDTVVSYYDQQIALTAQLLAEAERELAEAEKLVGVSIFSSDLEALRKRVAELQQQLANLTLKRDQVVSGAPLTTEDQAALSGNNPSPEPTYGAGPNGATKTYGG